MKIFLSCSFSTKINYDTNEVIPEFRQELETLLSAIRQAGHSVFAAIETENWKVGDDPPEVGARLDITQLETADAVLALLHDKPSAGVQWEIGYANALKKTVLISVQDESKLSYWNQGLVGLQLVKQVSYDKMNGFKELAAGLGDMTTAQQG